MKASWEKIEKNVGVLDIEVDAEQVAAALDKAFKKVVQKVNVPGFRKGKVPRAIFESKFGVESLYQDALDIIVPEAYISAVQETGIEPVDRPEVDVEQFGKGQTLKFKAKVVVKPEVQLGEYKGIEVEDGSTEVTEEELNEELSKLQRLSCGACSGGRRPGSEWRSGGHRFRRLRGRRTFRRRQSRKIFPGARIQQLHPGF
ncbi:trigger factor family protein [Paenibacillus sp. P25]|nr:trigger factor family protein [Paenibacillus sp. P25]